MDNTDKQTITASASPRPWSLFVHEEQEGGDGEISICAEGEWIATMNMRRSTAKSDAALIVDAVNQYEDAETKSPGTYSEAVVKFIKDRHLAFDPTDEWIPKEFVLWLFGEDRK